MNRVLSGILASTLALSLVTSTATVRAEEMEGTDKSTASSWAVSHIVDAESNRLLEGVDSIYEEFTRYITREEFCKIIMNCFTQIGGIRPLDVVTDRFEDVSSDNLDILHANALGIVSGTGDTTFSPNNNIKRQELAVMMQRCAEYFGSADPSNPEPNFADRDNIADWAVSSVAFVQEIGALNGTDTNEILPTNNLTCEAAVISVNSFFKAMLERTSNPESTTPDVGGSSLSNFYETLQNNYEFPIMMETPMEYVVNLYPGLTEIPTKSSCIYMPVITGVGCEIALVEAENQEDLSRIVEIFNERIFNQQGELQNYPSVLEAWANYSSVEVNSNYVMLVLHENYEAMIADFHNLGKALPEIPSTPDLGTATLDIFYSNLQYDYEFPMMMETPSEFLENLYPTLSAVETRSASVYMPAITGVACEIALVEVLNPEDVAVVTQIFNNRILSQQEELGNYPSVLEAWQNQSAIVVNGNYVMLVLHENFEQMVSDFNSLG